MSVVNKMLQDLEARKAQPDGSAEYQAPEKANNRLWLLLVTLTVLAVIAWLVYRNMLAPEKQPSVINPNPVHLTASEISTLANNVQQQGEPNRAALLAAESQLETLDTGNNTPNSNNQSDTNLAPNPEIELPVEKPVDKPLIAQVSSQNIEPETAQETQTSKSTQSETPVTAFVKTKNNKATSNTDSTEVLPSEQTVTVKSAPRVETEDDIRRQVQIALQRNNDPAAINLLIKLVDIAPDNQAARKRLAAMLFSKGEHGQAHRVLGEGLARQPDNIELRMMQAKLYVQLQQSDKAHDLLNRYTANQSHTLLSYRAALAQQLERFNSAQKDYQQLTQNQPANAKWWLGLAIANERLNNTQQALLAYQSAKRLSQLSVEVDRFVEQRIQYLAGVN